MTEVHPPGQQLSGTTVGSTKTVFASPTKKFTGKNIAGTVVVFELEGSARQFKIEGPARLGLGGHVVMAGPLPILRGTAIASGPINPDPSPKLSISN